jgi:predicted ribosome quality control (RQC) complex YloA/Tae2 family protein
MTNKEDLEEQIKCTALEKVHNETLIRDFTEELSLLRIKVAQYEEKIKILERQDAILEAKGMELTKNLMEMEKEAGN